MSETPWVTIDQLRAKIAAALEANRHDSILTLADRATNEAWEYIRELNVAGDAATVERDHAPSVSPADAGEAREVASGDARVGDAVTHVLRGRISRLASGAATEVAWEAGGTSTIDLEWPTVSVSRLASRPPSPPLPTEPGAVGTATVRGVKGVRVFRADPIVSPNLEWLTAGQVGGRVRHSDGDITDYVEELPAPAGAGVSAPGQEG